MIETGRADLSLADPQLVENENAGNRLAQSRVYIDLFNSDGRNVGRFEGSRARIYPGTSFRHSVPIIVEEKGKYEALFVIDIGDGNSYGAQYTLEL